MSKKSITQILIKRTFTNLKIILMDKLTDIS